MKWIKFSEKKPESFIDILYCYLNTEDKSKTISIGWIENSPEEDLTIVDNNGFLMYDDDENYRLIAWMPLPKLPDF